jgi:hypothetical protein
VFRFGRLADLREKVITGLLAAATDRGANTTVLLVSGVALALFGAGEAGRRTGLDHRGDEAEIGRGLPRHDPAGGVACVGAV